MNIASVRSAVAATHDPFTSQEVRAQAFQACESIKTSFEGCVQVAMQLITVDQPDIMRHFALHLLDHVVTKMWNSCSPEQKAMLKQTSLELLNSGCRDMESEQAFIKHAISKFISEIAKREWPQHWTSLTDSLVEIASKKEICLELVLCVLRDLAEATNEYSFLLPERRRQEIQHGLAACMPQLFPLLEGALASQLSRYQANQQSRTPIILLQTTFNTLSAYAEWVNEDFMLKAEFVSNYCATLSFPELFPKAEPVLQKLLRRSAATHWDVMVAMIQHTLRLISAIPDQYLFNASELLHCICRSHLDILASNEALRNQAFNSALTFFSNPDLRVSTPAVQFWVQVMRSHQIAITAKESNALQNMHTAGLKILPMEMRQMIVLEVFKVCTKQVAKTKDESRGEFDNEDDFALAFSTFRGNLMNLLRTLASLEPLLALQVTAENLAAAVDLPMAAPTPKSVSTGWHNNRGQVTMSHPKYLAYEAACSLLELVLKQFPVALFQSQSGGSSLALTYLEQLLSKLLANVSTEAVILGRQLFAMRLFIPLFQQNAAALQAALDLLFKSINFLPAVEAAQPTSDEFEMSDDTRAVRRRACHSLLSLANSVPQYMLPIFQSLVQRVIQVSSFADTCDVDRTALFQFLVATSNAMPDRSQQRAFIAEMTQQMVAQLQAEPVTRALSSFHQFVAAFGLFQPELESRSAPAVDFRIRFRSVLLNFSGILRGIQATDDELRSNQSESDAQPASMDADDEQANADAPNVPLLDVSGAAKSGVMLQSGWPLLQSILPYVLQIVSLLHAMYTSQARQLIPSQLRAILAPCREEMAVLNEADKAIKDRSLAVSSKASSPVLKHVQRCQSWLHSLRDSTYTILAAATLAGPALFQTYTPQALVGSIFSHLDSMEARHWRMLIERFITPLAANCPSEDYQRLLLPVLQVIVTTVFGRLSTGWLSASAEDYDQDADDADVLEEMLDDRFLRELTRAFGFFVANMCIPHAGYGIAGMTLATSIAAAEKASNGAAHTSAGSAPKVRVSTHQDTFCAFVLANETLHVPLFAVLTGCLCWPDDASTRRAVSILTRFIPLVAERPAFHQVFAGVLTAALRRLMAVRVEALTSCHTDVIVLVREIYFNFIRFSTMPREVFASLPGMQMSDLQNFEENLTRSATNSDKKLRQMCRQFLEKYAIGVGLPSQREKASALLDLPETLVLQSAKLKESAPDWKESNISGLQRLFQQ